MLALSKKEGGGKSPEEEVLNIPSFVRITNTSGFAIPASILNRAWIALSHQIVNRDETAVSALDHNFLVYLWNHATGTTSIKPFNPDTMNSYADTVYSANIGQNFATCIIPDVFWDQTGYQTTRLEKKFGEKEGYIDLRIWVEGFDNESLSGSGQHSSSNLPAIQYINIGTTFGQTVWCTDFLPQRMKAYNEAITKLFIKDPEAPQIEHDSTDTLFCKTTIDEEAPIISPMRDDLYQFATKDSHRFLIQACLNNDTKDCIKSMQDSDSKFPNFKNVSKLYYGLEVIPISSQGFSRLEPVMVSTKRPKAKGGKKKRRKAKRKNEEEEQAAEDSSVSTIHAETTEINSDETKFEELLEVSAEENGLVPTMDETSDVTHLLEEATASSTEARTPESINSEEGITTDQPQTNLYVAMTSHVQETSRFTAQFESQAGQSSQSQTIQAPTLPKDTPVSVTTLARDEAISAVTPTGDAPMSATIISGTNKIPTGNSASLQTTAPATDTVSSQTVAPTRGAAASQTPAKDAVALQVAAPVGVQAISQLIAATSASSNHTGAQIAPTPVFQAIIDDRARVIAHLRAQPPPPSLEEARARRASIKEERRQNIDFIRQRTSSRASALARAAASTAPSDFSGPPQPSGQLLETTGQSPTLLRPLNPSLDETIQTTTTPPRLASLPSPVAQENAKQKRGKWVAPLPEDQEWSVSHPQGRSAGPAASSGPQKRKSRRDVKSSKSGVESRASVGTQTDAGLTSCSVGTQTEFGVATTIAEDLVPGAGPVPSREDESAGDGNPPPSVTSRASLQRELELTSIVEDPALEQDCGGEYARGILTMATPSTPHTQLVAELREAGVPLSALTSLSRSGLEGHEATGCRRQPVGILLEVETVTIGGVTFEARRRGSRHRIAASVPRLELDW
ncbi:hypothetical protein VE03_00715 [Pseudogymnoascus sp. 23342-1-I1]|nr:hypothetical protein VE03_00715 [Pseudogymnoascus sp. 23342-1-I1]